jgi:hypothetical protein
MSLRIFLYSTLCSSLFAFPVFANEKEDEKSVHSGAIEDEIEAELNEDEDMDFPDEPYAPPAEGASVDQELPLNKLIGYDEGFFIRNASDTFSLKFNGMAQVRYIYSQADGVTDFHRFSLRRTDLYFTGHFLDESWTYVLGTEAGPDGTFATDDVYIAKAFTEGTWGQAGQFSTPFLRETLISSTRQLTVERSLVSKYFSTNNSTGILYGAENNLFKWEAAAVNGYFEHDPDDNEDVVDHEFQSGLTYAFISRLEFKPFGDWREFRGFNSFGENDTGLLIGVAGAYQRDNDEADIEETSGTVDVTLQGGGWSTFAMVAATKDRINDENTSYGAQIQGGLFVDEDRDTVELFSRYEWGDSSAHAPEHLPETDSEDLSVLTAGFNYYIYPRHLKLTTDFGYAFSSMGENWADETDGWRVSDESGQWVGRMQLQLVI